MSYESILYEEQGEIGVLTLNMPEKRNALGVAAEKEITACLKDAGRTAGKLQKSMSQRLGHKEEGTRLMVL